MEKSQRQSARKTIYKIPEPPEYKVIMHNDDVTTMDFVVFALKKIFNKSADEATALMLAIHHTGAATVGTYSYDIARSKAELTMELAKRNGFPLKLTTEKA